MESMMDGKEKAFKTFINRKVQQNNLILGGKVNWMENSETSHRWWLMSAMRMANL
jgi:hypothetical protein